MRDAIYDDYQYHHLSHFSQIAIHDQINTKLVLRNAVPDIKTEGGWTFPLKRNVH